MIQDPRPKSRFRFAVLLLFIALICALGIFHLRRDQADRDLNIITIKAKRGTLLDEVYGRGHVSSSENVDILSPLDGETTIVQLLPEGVYVKKDEPIARLDTEKLEMRITSYQGWLDETPGQIEHMRNELENLEFNLEEYMMGTVKAKWMQIENDIVKKRENLRQCKDSVRMSEQLLSLGYTTKAQLDIDRVARQRSENDLKESLLEKEIFIKYTSEKKITDIISEMESVKTSLDETSIWIGKIEKELKKLLEQYDSAVIKAPNSGRIVYANQVLRPGRNENEMIREGARVRKGQLLFRIPDPSTMQIQALLTEENVFRTKPGMKAFFVFDVQKKFSFEGEVIKVNQYPELDRHSPVKKYIVQIRINDTDLVLKAGIDLRTGFSADVRIVVNEENDRLLLPTHAILSSGEKDYCLFFHRGKWKYREILLGTTSDRKAVVLEGLSENEAVVAGAIKYREKISLPAPDAPSRFKEKKDLLKKELEAASKEKTNDPDPGKNDSLKKEDPSSSLNKENSPKEKKDHKNTEENDPDQKEENLVKEEIKTIKEQYKKYAPIRKYLNLTTIEFCQKLDKNSNDKIEHGEIQKEMPELLMFIKEWDRNQNGILDYTDLAIGLYKVRNLFKKADSLIISHEMKEGGNDE